MNSLDFQIAALYTLAYKLLHLGSDGSPIYSDRFGRLNGGIFNCANTLYPHHGPTDEEETRLCPSLLMGCNAAIYNNGDKEIRIQQILSHCWGVLDRPPTSLLKVQPLTYYCGEVSDDDLSRETHSTIDSWGKRALFGDECEIAEQLRSPEENPYPNWEVEE